MQEKQSTPARFIDEVPVLPSAIYEDWLMEHLNMEIPLRAYVSGVADSPMGPTDTFREATDKKMALINAKISVRHTNGADFPLTDDEIQQTLCLFPVSWLQHAILKTVTVRPPAHFATKQYQEHYFIAGVEDMQNGERYFNGSKLSDRFYEEHGITPPVSDFHYVPGQYVDDDQDILLYAVPEAVRRQISLPALQQYGRGLIVHEFLHAVLHKDANLLFQLPDGTLQDYESILRQFYEICQREPGSVSEYSELYSPLLNLPFNVKDFWITMALQEELGELLSSTVLGWGATPKGEAKRIDKRDFGGTAFGSSGKSEKLAFAQTLLASAVVRNEVGATQERTASAVTALT